MIDAFDAARDRGAGQPRRPRVVAQPGRARLPLDQALPPLHLGRPRADVRGRRRRGRRPQLGARDDRQGRARPARGADRDGGALRRGAAATRSASSSCTTTCCGSRRSATTTSRAARTRRSRRPAARASTSSCAATCTAATSRASRWRRRAARDPDGHRLVVASAGTATSSRGRKENAGVNFYNWVTVDADSFTVAERLFDAAAGTFQRGAPDDVHTRNR